MNEKIGRIYKKVKFDKKFLDKRNDTYI